MKFEVLIVKLEKELSLDLANSLPQEWVWIDRLSQGLVSRYLWSQSRFKKSARETKPVESPWLMLQPFAPLAPLILAIWNSKEPIDIAGLGIDKDIVGALYFDENSISSSDLGILRENFPSIQVWKHGQRYPSQVVTDES